MSKKIFLLVAFLVAGILLLPSQLTFVYANPGVDGAVWFYPKYDTLPIYPDTGQNTLQLWVTPLNTTSTGIREVEIWVPKDLNGLALYRVREVHVALFIIDNLSSEQKWILDPGNWTVSLTNIDANGNPTLIIASALNTTADALYNSSAGVPYYFRGAVFELIVEYYRGDVGADGLAHTKWSVTISGTDLSSKNFLVDHYVDVLKPEVKMSSATESLLSSGILNTLSFNFTVSITDNSGLSGLNFSLWGIDYPNWFLGGPTGVVEDTVNYIFWWLPWSIKNAYTAPSLVDIAPFNGTPVPEWTTYGEDGYLWGVLVIIANDTSGNYTQMYPLVSLNGGNTFMAYDDNAGRFGVNLSLTSPNWLGGAAPSLAEFTAKFYVISFDGTIDYHWDCDSILGVNYWGAIVNTSVTPIENNTGIDFMKQVFVDTVVHNITDVELNGVSPGTGGIFGTFNTGEFTLSWNWTYPLGPDPTFDHFRVVIYHEDSNTLLLDTNTTDFSLDFTVEATGIGNYNVSIFVKDSYAEEVKFKGYFTVTEFVIVWLNGKVSKWSDYPDWLTVPQMGSVVVSIKTFGRAYDEPQQGVNVTVTEQYLSGGVPSYWTIIENAPASVVGGTATYGEWQFPIDVKTDLNNNISIYNVTVVWYNTSTSDVIALNENNTFMVKRVLYLNIWTDDSAYTTGETVTFFAYVHDITGQGLDSVPISVSVTDPTGYLIASTAGYTVGGYVIPSIYGTIMFGTPIGDAWVAGNYSVLASAAVEELVGSWFNSSSGEWENVTTLTTMSNTTSFTVSSLRHQDLLNAINSVSSSLASVADSLNDIKSSIADLSSAVSDLTSLVNSVSSKVDNVLSSLSDLSSAVSDLTSLVNSVSSKVDNVLSSLSDLGTTLSNLNDSIGSLSSALSNANSKLDNVLSGLSNLATKSDVSSVASGVNNVASNLSTMSNNLSSTLGSLSSLLTATAVLVIITLIIAAVATFKVFKG